MLYKIMPVIILSTNEIMLFIHVYDLMLVITKTCQCNLYPIKPHFYIEKLGFVGVYQIVFFDPKHTLWVLVRTASLRRI